MWSTARHRTAIQRVGLSRPIQLSLTDGLIRADTSVFDYGCGRGGDLERLHQQGIPCAGWDPAYRAENPKIESDIVNLGYVLNVIEEVDERIEVLRSAWALARCVLVVAARIDVEARPHEAALHKDGFVTRLGTFQKLYQQQELSSFIESTLGVTPVPAGPGVFYVFRDEAQRQSFLASRYRRIGTRLRIERHDELYEKHKVILQPLLDFLCRRGRLPQPDELANASDISTTFGSIQRAFRVLSAVVEDQEWERRREQQTQDLIIYLALTKFSRRPRLSELSADLQQDIRSFFTSYQAACELADAMLFSAGDMKLIDQLCRQASVGKLTPAALYVHETAIGELDPILRLYEGCARAYIGAVEGANLIKLNRRSPQISYLGYPDFDTDPHPALRFSFIVPLQTFHVDVRHYDQAENPPILHRKEEFVSSDYPSRDKFARLTTQEERHGLYEKPQHIGMRKGWLATLAQKKVTLRGHRVIRTS